MMEYVLMKPEHVAQIAQLEKICFPDPWDARSVASELKNPLSLWLVALDGDTVAGYVGSQTVCGETDMINVAFHPDYRLQGMARQLIENLIEKLKAQGSHWLMLEVRSSNGDARALYEKLGFQQVGLRKNYYRNPKEDALILRKEWQI